MFAVLGFHVPLFVVIVVALGAFIAGALVFHNNEGDGDAAIADGEKVGAEVGKLVGTTKAPAPAIAPKPATPAAPAPAPATTPTVIPPGTPGA